MMVHGSKMVAGLQRNYIALPKIHGPRKQRRPSVSVVLAYNQLEWLTIKLED